MSNNIFVSALSLFVNWFESALVGKFFQVFPQFSIKFKLLNSWFPAFVWRSDIFDTIISFMDRSSTQYCDKSFHRAGSQVKTVPVVQKRGENVDFEYEWLQHTFLVELESQQIFWRKHVVATT